jgi:hypothetical protein
MPNQTLTKPNFLRCFAKLLFFFSVWARRQLGNVEAISITTDAEVHSNSDAEKLKPIKTISKKLGY